MGTHRPRRRRDPYTRTVVRLPERELSDSVLSLAGPLIENLGPTPETGDVQAAVGLAIDLWNAHVTASEYWGDPRRKPLADLRRKMCGKKAKSGHAEMFELLSSRWRKEFSTDPRLVGEWSLEVHDDGQVKLTCEATLPDGVEVEIPPPIEKRIAINGKFLDEVQIRLSPGTPRACHENGRTAAEQRPALYSRPAPHPARSRRWRADSGPKMTGHASESDLCGRASRARMAVLS